MIRKTTIHKQNTYFRFISLYDQKKPVLQKNLEKKINKDV